MPPKILVVEDEPAIAESVSYALRRDGFDAEIAGTAAQAQAQAGTADLIVLDLMLPDGSGFDLIQRWRQSGSPRPLPIIVLSSRDAEADRVAALEGGADDYVSKPFSPREIVARVRAVLRRTRGTATPGSSAIGVELETRRATVSGRALELTRVEFDLLACLAAAPGRVFSRAELIDQVWGDGFAMSDRTVDSHIKALRKKMTDVGADPGVLETVRGVGFRIVESFTPGSTE
jgi:two-component system catabolic regulation response regulator CreB